MSPSGEQIEQLVYRVIDDFNDQLPEDRCLKKHPETILFGEGGMLDSLGLVNLIVATEDLMAEAFGGSLVLADEKAMSQQRSPFRTVSALVEYITQRLESADA